MATKNANISRLLARLFATGILLSMITVYLLHFFGTWEAGIERPDAETTSSVIVTNKCALLGDNHILRPGATFTNRESTRELKLAGSFMNFSDGHVIIIIVIACVFAIIMFTIKKTGSSSPSSFNSNN